MVTAHDTRSTPWLAFWLRFISLSWLCNISIRLSTPTYTRSARTQAFLAGSYRKPNKLTKYPYNYTKHTINMPHNFKLVGGDEETLTKTIQLGLWKNAPNLKTLFDLNKLYLLGQLKIHPGHGVPLYAESTSLKAKLLEMNEHGLFTFQGQPRTGAGHEDHKPPHTHFPGDVCDTSIERSETAAYCYVCAGLLGRWAECSKSSYKRQMPYTQFCMPVSDEGPGLTAVCAARLAQELLLDDRVHVQVSWPKSLDLLWRPIDLWCMPWKKADSTSAKKYISEEDLEMYHHFKSLHGTPCPQEILTTTATTTPGTFPTAPEAEDPHWHPIRDDWSQVNDYHMLRPRVPDFFLGPGAKTVVFGVNAVKWEGGIEDIEQLVLDKVKALKLKKPYPTLSLQPSSEEKAESEVEVPGQIDFEDWAETEDSASAGASDTDSWEIIDDAGYDADDEYAVGK